MKKKLHQLKSASPEELRMLKKMAEALKKAEEIAKTTMQTTFYRTDLSDKKKEEIRKNSKDGPVYPVCHHILTVDVWMPSGTESVNMFKETFFEEYNEKDSVEDILKRTEKILAKKIKLITLKKTKYSLEDLKKTAAIGDAAKKYLKEKSKDYEDSKVHAIYTAENGDKFKDGLKFLDISEEEKKKVNVLVVLMLKEKYPDGSTNEDDVVVALDKNNNVLGGGA